MCGKSVFVKEGTDAKRVFNCVLTTCIWGLAFRSRWAIYLVLSPLIILASQTLFHSAEHRLSKKRSTCSKSTLNIVENRIRVTVQRSFFFLSLIILKWILQSLPLSKKIKIYQISFSWSRWQSSTWRSRLIQGSWWIKFGKMATTVLVSSSSCDKACWQF